MTRWTPRSPGEALTQCDTLLAELTPHYRTAIEKLTDLQPGHSGRPAGGGEPGGGSGFTATSIAERTALNPNPERNRLDRALALPDIITAIAGRYAEGLAITLGEPFPPPPPRATPSQKLTWSAWIARQAQKLRKPPSLLTLRFHRAICELHDIVTQATQPTHHPTPAQPDPPGTDLTGNYCVNCLKYGHREPRSTRYPELCNWCGRFTAEQGFTPTHNLVDARQAGRRVTATMVNNERKQRKRK